MLRHVTQAILAGHAVSSTLFAVIVVYTLAVATSQHQHAFAPARTPTLELSGNHADGGDATGRRGEHTPRGTALQLDRNGGAHNGRTACGAYSHPGLHHD